MEKAQDQLRVVLRCMVDQAACGHERSVEKFPQSGRWRKSRPESRAFLRTMITYAYRNSECASVLANK